MEKLRKEVWERKETTGLHWENGREVSLRPSPAPPVPHSAHVQEARELSLQQFF